MKGHLSTSAGICANDGSPDCYPHHPEDLEMDWYLQSNFPALLTIINYIKEAGNIFYRQVGNIFYRQVGNIFYRQVGNIFYRQVGNIF
jgi:hypothetical protein